MEAPSTLKTLYSVLAIVKLDTTAILHPACYTGPPFRTELVQLFGRCGPHLES